MAAKKVKATRQSLREVNDTARGARAYLSPEAAKYKFSESVLQETAMNLSRGKAKGMDKILGRSPTAAEKKSARMMQGTRAAETTRSAVRATGSTRRAKKVAEEKAVRKAFTGSSKKTTAKKTTSQKRRG